MELAAQDEKINQAEAKLQLVDHNNKQGRKALKTIQNPIWTAIKGLFVSKPEQPAAD